MNIKERARWRRRGRWRDEEKKRSVSATYAGCFGRGNRFNWLLKEWMAIRWNRTFWFAFLSFFFLPFSFSLLLLLLLPDSLIKWRCSKANSADRWAKRQNKWMPIPNKPIRTVAALESHFSAISSVFAAGKEPPHREWNVVLPLPFTVHSKTSQRSLNWPIAQ